MRLDERHDMVNSLFEIERQKIPFFVRMTPLKKKILKALIFTFSFIEMLIICWYPRWYGAAITDYSKQYDGTFVVYRIIPSGYISAIIIGLLPFIPILLYIFFVYLFEKTAYSNANRKALDLAEDRRLLTLEKDRELIRKLNKDKTVGLINKEEDEEETLPPGHSIEEEIDSFFRR